MRSLVKEINEDWGSWNASHVKRLAVNAAGKKTKTQAAHEEMTTAGKNASGDAFRDGAGAGHSKKIRDAMAAETGKKGAEHSKAQEYTVHVTNEYHKAHDAHVKSVKDEIAKKHGFKDSAHLEAEEKKERGE